MQNADTLKKSLLYKGNEISLIIEPRSEGDNVLGNVHPSVRPSPLSWLNRLTYDLDIWYLGWPWPWLGWDCRSRSEVKGQGQMPKMFWHHCYLALRSRSKVKATGQSRRSRSNFWCTAVDVRGSACLSVCRIGFLITLCIFQGALIREGACPPSAEQIQHHRKVVQYVMLILLQRVYSRKDMKSVSLHNVSFQGALIRKGACPSTAEQILHHWEG